MGRADGKQEEVYNFRSDPRENGATVILTVDTSSFVGKSSLSASTLTALKATNVKNNAEYTDNGTSTGNYPSQGDPHPIGTYPFMVVSIVKLMHSMVHRVPNFRRAIDGRSTESWPIILHLPGTLRFK
jgi:hypothetical protein